MSRSSVIIISPSGAFYGSEQVLFDYVSHTRISADIALPRDSYLQKKLKEAFPHHKLRTFQSTGIIKFYLKLFLWLLINRYRTVYLNEAGHVKYILLLAKLFPRKKFIVHVRIVEDTAKERWIVKPGKNVTIIAISNYIAAQLLLPALVLYDPFPFTQRKEEITPIHRDQITIGIIGRITLTKGLSRLIDLLKLMEERGISNQFQFKLFGTVSEDAIQNDFEKKLQDFHNVTIAGFESSKDKLYGGIDCVMHLSTQEALGRIYLEAIDYNKPFIGLKAAGIGEIAALLHMNAWMADPNADNPPQQLLDILENIRMNYHQSFQKMISYKPEAKKIFDIGAYTNSIDKLLTQ